METLRTGGVGLTFTGISSDRAEQYWPMVEPLLLPAILMSEGRHTCLTTRRCILDEKMQLWAGFEDEAMTKPVFAVVTQTNIYPTGLEELEIVFCGGDVIPHNLPVLKLIEEWGSKSVGCTEAQLIGRKGWSRVLKDYEEVAVVLRKRLVA